jgi:vacuolar-type H+-ATPase subunit H
MLGLAAIGGVLYMHKKRGGEWTLDSFKDSARQLLKSIEQNADRAKKTAREALDEASKKADKMAERIGGNTGRDFRH